MIFLILNIYLFLNEGSKFTDNYKKIGFSGLVGGICLGIANITFVFSITTTTAAVTLMMLGAMPFIAALLAYFFLKETISKSTLIAMIIAATGIIFISFDSKETGTLFGLINGLISSSAFAGFTVSLRWRKKIPKLTIIYLGGIIAAIISLLVLFFMMCILISLKLFLVSATWIFSLFCLILYSSNAKYLPAAELTLLSLTEVLGGIFGCGFHC